MPDDLLKAGEFAHLCGTTKETLRHYKDIGLLMPVAKAENGYQLYSPLQIGDYLLISSLQQAGCSLQEIKGYLSEPDSEALENVMEDRISAIVEQHRTLLMQKSLLENTLARMRARNDWRHDPAEFKLETCEAEYFLDSDISDAFVSIAEAICQLSSMNSLLRPRKRPRRSFRMKALTRLTVSRSAQSIPLKMACR